MQTYKVTIKSVSPYSSSRYHNTPKKDRETADAYEQRTWRNKLTVVSGKAVIPARAFFAGLVDAAKQLGLQIPGKGKRTYAKSFAAGVMIESPLPLAVDPETCPGTWVHVNADGVSGSGKRVMRCFPTVEEWGGEITLQVLDDAITRDVLERHLDFAGKFVGVGQYRPQNRGTNGRYQIVKVEEI